MLDKYLDKTEFATYDDFMANFKIKVPENFNFGYDIVDEWAKIEPNKKALLWTNDKGEEKVIETKLCPCYVLVKMTMTDESWHVVRNITGVTGFVGPGSEPVPLTDQEVEAFNIETHSEELSVKVGDMVTVISGSFEGFEGKVQEISEDKKEITVLVSTHRREFPIIVEAKDIRIAE